MNFIVRNFLQCGRSTDLLAAAWKTARRASVHVPMYVSSISHGMSAEKNGINGNMSFGVSEQKQLANVAGLRVLGAALNIVCRAFSLVSRFSPVFEKPTGREATEQ